MPPTGPTLLDAQALAAVRSRIRHVFVLMLENRSFDHLFALSGIPGIRAATAEQANTWNGTRYAFQGDAPDRMPTDPGHEFADVVEQLCGTGAHYVAGQPYPAIDNSGFAANYATTSSEGKPPAAGDVDKIMRGIDTPRQSPALFTLATEFVICDQWFSSLPGPTWPNRYFLHGASASGLDHSPTRQELAEWETVMGFSYRQGSIFERLGAGRWRIYQDESGPLTGRIPQVASIQGVNFADIEDLEHFAEDLANDYAWPYTFIEPSYGDVAGNTYQGGSSQHPMDGLDGGDRLVATVYNAIRKSPLWNSSLLIVTYDEHGGFYDSVAPGAAVPPGDGAGGSLSSNGFDFTRYGVRVPAVIVSPWVMRAVVDHTLYDHATVAATLARLLDLAPLTDRDRHANDLLALIGDQCRNDCPARIG